MLSVAPSVLVAIDAPTRRIRAKAIIYFNTPLTITGDDYLVGFDSLEEESLDTAGIYGNISANECALKLLNTDRIFSITNTSSPYYGQLKPGLKVEVFFQVYTTSFIDVPLGTFYTAEWPMGATGTFVDLVCRDRLQHKKAVSAIKVQKNITVKTAIENLFSNAGVINYSVDNSLTYQIPYWCHGNSTLLDELQKFSSGYGCRIYVDKNDTIVVKKARTGASVRTLTDADQIINLTSRSDARNITTAVVINYTTFSKSNDEIPIELPIGANIIDYYRPIDIVKSVISTNNLTNLYWTCNNVYLTASAITEGFLNVVSLVSNSNAYEKANASLVALYGEIVKTVYSSIIQSEAEAIIEADSILSSVSVEKIIEIKARGNPALELGDRVSISNGATATVGDYYIARIKYEFNGALQAAYTLSKVV